MYTEASGDDRSFVVDEGLKHSTSYVFQVRTVDTDGDAEDDSDIGNGTWAPATGVVEPTDDADAPEQVEDLELVAMDMMIVASWEEADTDSDFPLTGYELKITPKDGPTDVMNIGVMEEYTFEGLMNGTEYTVAVAARNEIGLGMYSDDEKATPMMPTPTLTLFGALALGAGL